MALEKLEALIRFSAAQSVSVQEYTPNAGPASVTIASAVGYFLSTSTSLLSAIGTALTADGTLGGTYTCTLNSTTGKVTLAASGVTTFSLTWTSTTIRDYLGFTGNLSGAASYTGTRQARFLWLPDVGRTNPEAPIWASTSYALGSLESDQTFTTSPAGTTKVIAYTTRRKDNFEWSFLAAPKVWLGHESTVNESFERLWLDALVLGRTFNYHPDATSDAVFWPFRAEMPSMAPSFANATWYSSSSKFGVKFRAVAVV